MKRWLKYQCLKLVRTRGAAGQVARGFCIGLAVEMVTLPTAGLAFFLIFPLVYMMRGRLAAALIGFVFGKLIYIPFAVVNERVGHWILPMHWMVHAAALPDWLNRLLTINMNLIVGGMIDGAMLALLLYIPMKQILLTVQERRRQKRRHRHAHG
ncbi:DUF2062 domain-containing protein [Paenibacillus thiaminolyticus]|uniref:DUF2062 domain-containing protein n=1 Tax=Paenibacillus thiaminolyticus TaxID=49283 RepID=UPI0025435EA3|nr:DUF2062 domain-containing protein [Paenibacillus thiaminolyticus]WII36308.1 DUF2062 domain-containing protein [Paenibacillus thiaminolyticus]